jgi:DNA-binding transcriptional MerR regulator
MANNLTMPNAFASEQTRILTIDLHKRQLQKEGVAQEKIYELIDKSDEMAQKNITHRSPKFKGLLLQWEADYTQQRQEAAVN